MKILPLLATEGNRLYDGSLVRDLELDGLLSGESLRILRSPCTPPVGRAIADRQAFFAAMDDPEFARRLEDFSASLFALSKRLEAWGQSNVRLERLCLRFQALSGYLDVCRTLENLRGLTPLADRAAKAMFDGEHLALLSALEADLIRAAELFRQIEFSVYLLADGPTVADRAWLIPDGGQPTFREQLDALAARMGLDVGASRSGGRVKRMVDVLGDAYGGLYPDQTDELCAIAGRYDGLDLSAPLVWLSDLAFFREIHELTDRAKATGIPVCLPKISRTKRYLAKNLTDVTLLRKNCPKIVPNDADFDPSHPFFFLIGANGGGKTTYLRAVGVNLLFFLSGCPIFAESGEIYPFSGLFSHFPEDEDFSGMGRLDAERIRVERILSKADGDAFLLLNETFSATDEEKGFDLAVSTAKTLQSRGIFGLFVTHFLQVRGLDFPILSAVVEEDGEHRRTFKIARADGGASSFAKDILRKYRLDARSLAERGRKA